jgi:hypothetical protein
VKLNLPAPLTIHLAGSVEVYSDPVDGAVPERSSPTLPWVHAMRQQAINFLKVCRGEMKPPCDASEAVEDLKIARDYVRLRFGAATMWACCPTPDVPALPTRVRRSSLPPTLRAYALCRWWVPAPCCSR